MPAEAGIAAQRAGLQSLIDEEESRLEAPGFTGDNLLAEPHRPLTPETMRLLAGLLSNLLAELYANIAKHAAPHEWYAVTISFDRRHVIISASDVLKDEAVRLGLGSGLKRYRTVIESMSGTFDIIDDSDNWNANITIPLSVTRR